MNTCVINYANTFLLVWDFNKVWRYDTTWLPPKLIREFDSSYLVYAMTQEWNYLKIYTSNWVSTKVHYAKGTFDVEYTWLIQTVSFVWLSINYWCVASDQWTDYAVFSFAPGELKLAKISGYNKTDLGLTKAIHIWFTIHNSMWLSSIRSYWWMNMDIHRIQWMVMVRMCRVQRKQRDIQRFQILRKTLYMYK